MEPSKIDKLKELSELFKAGILTKEEVEEQKNKILNETSLTSSLKNNSENSSHKLSDKDNVESFSKNNDVTNHTKGSVNYKPLKSKDNKSSSFSDWFNSNRKKAYYLIATILVLIGTGVFIGLYQHRQNEIALAQQREQERLDSIAEVERLLEKHRLDSIAEVERIRREREDFINTHPLLASTFLTVKSVPGYSNHNLSFKNYLTDTLREYRFEKISSEKVDYQIGTEGGPPDKVFQIVYERDGTSISIITHNEKLNHIYKVEINFHTNSEVTEFMKNAMKMGFENRGDGIYIYTEASSWCIVKNGNKLRISCVP